MHSNSTERFQKITHRHTHTQEHTGTHTQEHTNTYTGTHTTLKEIYRQFYLSLIFCFGVSGGCFDSLSSFQRGGVQCVHLAPLRELLMWGEMEGTISPRFICDSPPAKANTHKNKIPTPQCDKQLESLIKVTIQTLLLSHLHTVQS